MQCLHKIFIKPRVTGIRTKQKLQCNFCTNLLRKFVAARIARTQFLQVRQLCQKGTPTRCRESEPSLDFAIEAQICFANSSRHALRAHSFSRPSTGSKEEGVPVGTPSSFGAGDGNRTRVFGLGSGHSAIELHLLGALQL